MSIVFVLVMMMYHGGIDTHLTFNTLQQCETVAEQAKKNGIYKAFCVEQQVKKTRKMDCKIENRTDYSSGRSGYNNNMLGYPYPVGFNCVEY